MPIFAKMQNHLKNELRNIISGKSEVRHGGTIQAITSYLERNSQASGKIEGAKQIREQETEQLKYQVLCIANALF